MTFEKTPAAPQHGDAKQHVGHSVVRRWWVIMDELVRSRIARWQSQRRWIRVVERRPTSSKMVNGVGSMRCGLRTRAPARERLAADKSIIFEMRFSSLFTSTPVFSTSSWIHQRQFAPPPGIYGEDLLEAAIHCPQVRMKSFAYARQMTRLIRKRAPGAIQVVQLGGQVVVAHLQRIVLPGGIR